MEVPFTAKWKANGDLVRVGKQELLKQMNGNNSTHLAKSINIFHQLLGSNDTRPQAIRTASEK